MAENSGLKTRIVNMKQYREKLTRLMNQRMKAVDAGDFEHNTPTFIWGAPGIGKSMILMSICKDTWIDAKDGKGKPVFDEKFLSRLRPWDASQWHWFTEADTTELKKNPQGWVLMDVRLSQVDPVEIKGAPFYDVKNAKASFLRFSSILPNPDSPWPVFLFLDEFPLAPDMVQSAGYQLINDRKVGDYRLPERCVVLAAGNQEQYGGVHFVMSPALESRFDHITLDIDYDGFVKYMAAGHGYDDTLIAFLQFSKEQDKNAIYKLDAGAGNFPTFRSWEKGARKIKYGEKEYEALADSVGQAVASKYDIFKELTKDIPDAHTLVSKKMYYDRVELQLVASQKIGNHLLNKELLTKLNEDTAFDFFRYFIDMKNPKDKTDNREELTILFLVNVREQMECLDKCNKGYQKALKAGTIKAEKMESGKVINNLYDLIFFKWNTLAEID